MRPEAVDQAMAGSDVSRTKRERMSLPRFLAERMEDEEARRED
jgi:hypothetical protein